MAIYFLKHENLIKIGFTDDVRKRAMSIISSSPVEVVFLGHMPGGRDVERHFHTVFAKDRERGEWFRESDRLMTVVATLASRMMPKSSTRERAIGTNGRARQEWNEASRILREIGWTVWPSATHQQRMLSLAEMLGWSNRRVRSLYEAERVGRLTGEEFERVSGLARQYLDAEEEVVRIGDGAA